MKIVAVLILSFLSLTACNSNAGKSVVSSDTGNNIIPAASNVEPAKPTAVAEEILGSFVGPFGDNKITLLITKAEGHDRLGPQHSRWQ